MTVLTEKNRSDHIISLAAVDYSYDFKVFDETDLVVKSRSSAGVETTLVLNSDYSVHGVGDSNGGYITPSVAYKAAHDGEALAIIRRVAVKQGTSIRNQGKFFPETHEDVFDYITMICQQVAESIGRTMILPDTASSEDFDPTLPVPVALSLLGWDSTGKKIQNFAGGASSPVSVAMAPVVAAATLAFARVAMGLGSAAVQDSTAFQAANVNLVDKTVVNQFTKPQKTTVTTNNSLTHDLSLEMDISCTPTGSGTLAFTNLAAGQKFEMLFINSSNYAIAKDSNIKCPASLFSAISSTGRYIIAGRCLDGTNVDLTVSGVLS